MHEGCSCFSYQSSGLLCYFGLLWATPGTRTLIPNSWAEDGQNQGQTWPWKCTFGVLKRLALVMLCDHRGSLAQLHIDEVQHGAEEGPFLAVTAYTCLLLYLFLQLGWRWWEQKLPASAFAGNSLKRHDLSFKQCSEHTRKSDWMEGGILQVRHTFLCSLARFKVWWSGGSWQLCWKALGVRYLREGGRERERERKIIDNDMAYLYIYTCRT